MKTISVLNQKGGVGKTTTAHALASYLTDKGHKVLMVDLDGQINLSIINGFNGYEEDGKTITDVFLRKINVKDAIVKTDNGYLLVGSKDLFTPEIILKDAGRDMRLKEILEDIKNDYDYCIIDNPPSLSTLTINGLTASDYCLIVAQADFLSINAIEQLKESIDAVKKYTNPKLKVLGVAITRYNNRAVISRDMVDIAKDVADTLNAKVYNTKIRECIAIKESQVMRKSIFNHDAKSNGALDYEELCKEIVGDIK